MLGKFNVPLPLLNKVLSEMSDKKQDAKTQATVFLKANPAVWSAWVPADVAAKVAASLK